MLQSLIRNFGFTEVTPSRNRKRKTVLSFAFRSIFRNFAPNFNKNKKPQ